jgi:hypothetical protein
MLERAETTQRSWFHSYKQNSNLYRKAASTWEQENWDLLEDMINKLHCIKSDLLDGAQYEPMGLLQDLYAVQDTLQGIYSHQAPQSYRQAHQPPAQPARYGAEDDYDEEDDYPDFVEDLEYMTLKEARKPAGRSPTAKSPSKATSSPSSAAAKGGRRK